MINVFFLFYTNLKPEGEKLNKFNNTRARMLDSIFHMILRLLMDVITFPEIYKPLVFYRFYCMALFHSQARRHMIISLPLRVDFILFLVLFL